MSLKKALRAVAAIAALSVAPLSASATDTRYPLAGSQVEQIVEYALSQLNTTCLPVVCTTHVNTPDTIGAAVLLSVGYVNVPVTVGSPSITPELELLAGCQYLLDGYLADTRHPGILEQYGVCVGGGAPGAALRSLPVSVGTVSFLAGVCVLSLHGHDDTSWYQTVFSGTTDCGLGTDAGQYGMRATVSGTAYLTDYLNGSDPTFGGFSVAGSTFSSSYIVGTSNGARNGYLATGTTLFGLLGQVQLTTNIDAGPPQNCPSSGATCGYYWVPVPVKSLDAGLDLSCDTGRTPNSLSGPSIACTFWSGPFSHSAL